LKLRGCSGQKPLLGFQKAFIVGVKGGEKKKRRGQPDPADAHAGHKENPVFKSRFTQVKPLSEEEGREKKKRESRLIASDALDRCIGALFCTTCN